MPLTDQQRAYLLETFQRMLTALLVLLIPMLAQAQTNADACRVSAYWWDHEAKLGSGLSILGRFSPAIGKEPTIQTFKLADSDMIITVGVEYEYKDALSEKPPISIRIAIAVLPEAEKTLFQSTDSAEAATRYGKKWNSLSISKRVNIGKLVYTVGLVCENAKNRPR
jgi:hypothetical protein